MANFIPQHDLGSCEFLNLRLLFRSQPCVHCGSLESLKAHGFLRTSKQIIRGVRFYCSGRDSNRGCGKTFSIHFEDYIPKASLSAQQLGEMIKNHHQPPDISETRPNTKIAKSTRYRWLKKFTICQSFIKARLHFISGPHKEAVGSSCSRTWQHLRKAFPEVDCVITAFQRVLQANPFSHRTADFPIYHRALLDGLSRFLAATRSGTLTSEVSRVHHFSPQVLTVDSG
jgi:hypothetical protein